MSDLHGRGHRTIERFGLLRTGDPVVVAVSGGADSVALLHLLADLRDEYALVLRIAHLNRRLRPDAGADAEFVRQTATNLGIPITVEEVDVSARAAAQKRSLEDAGRRARYEFFARVAGTMGAGCIATAHTQDDQVETVAMRLLQGAAWETLAGIPTSRRLGAATVVRPRFETTGGEIFPHLQDRHVTWRDDPTNRDRRFLRNWVRLTWLPALEARHPQTRGLLSEAGRLAGAADKFFEEMATVVLGQAHREGQTIQFPLGALGDLPQDVRQRVIRLAASEVSGTEVTPHDVVAIRGDDVATGRVGRDVRLERCGVRRGHQSVEVSMGTAAVARADRLVGPGEGGAGDLGIALPAGGGCRSSLPAMVRGGAPEDFP